MSLKRYNALDGLRGVCALSVVLFHLRVDGTATEWAFFRHADRFVEFFFVLSGFVLAHSAAQQRGFRIGTFVVARMFRLFPLHLALLVTFLALEVLKAVAASQGAALGGEPFTQHSAVSQILPNALLLQAWLPWTDPLSFNAPSWSISIEFYMYLIFASTIVAGSARLILWLALAAAALALSQMGNEWLTLEARRGLSCFFSGSCSYVFYQAVASRWTPSLFFSTIVESVCIGLIIIALSMGVNNELEIVTLFTVSVVTFAFEGGAISKVLKASAINASGKLSFSIYMTHYLVILCITYLLIISGKFFGINFVAVGSGVRIIDVGGLMANYILMGTVIIGVIAFSMVSFRFIELRGRSTGQRLSSRLRNKIVFNTPGEPVSMDAQAMGGGVIALSAYSANEALEPLEYPVDGAP